MGKTIQTVLAGDYRNAAQARFFEELREASQKRQERAELVAAILAGVAVGMVVAAINIVFPFIPA